MPDADVARIGSELGVTLPAHDRASVLAYPQSLRDAKFESKQESPGWTLGSPTS